MFPPLLPPSFLPVLRRSLFLEYGDLTDSSNLCELVARIRPDEIYNLAAQSHVKVSGAFSLGAVFQEFPLPYFAPTTKPLSRQ